MSDATPAIKTSAHPAESGHWYTRTGEQVLEIDGKKPDFRNKLVVKHDLAPGVTSIMRMKSQPGLTRWLQQEAIRCALTLPRKEDEPEQAWLDRILDDAGETARSAADEGTRIHAAIEKRFATGVFPDLNEQYAPHVFNVGALLTGIAPDEKWTAEKGVASPYGYGTKSDLHSPSWVIDFKGTEKPREDLRVYDSHWMQLAATRKALNTTKSPEYGDLLRGARCLIVYVHRTQAWAHAIEVKEPELARGWDLFKCCLRMWQIEKKYKPTWAIDP